MMNLIFINFMLSMIFILSKHPLMMGLILLIQTFWTCMISGMFSYTFWFSYILFIVFLGGLMVLFMYMVSIASNEMFNFKMNLMIMLYFMIIIMVLMNYNLDKVLIYPFMMNNEMNNSTMEMYYLPENSLNLMKLYNYPINILLFIIINYLLMTLIIVVKITNIFKGPLRSNL
uniref:NADH dehydrogenase subunit 6 n=1 Tax=Plecia hardyi TaxID=3097417 RepID=UPI002E793810|nr:NADH dehydrogenase subunit 6 [Plecia hardyi]WPM86398.1 NADH dehydrogenase subunit 6 [Plecia hardyi]